MIIDQQNCFTWADRDNIGQAILTTIVSENVIDLGLPAPGSNINDGSHMVEVVVQVTEDFDSAGDLATMAVELKTHSELPVSGGVVLQSSGVIAQADLVAGYQFSFAQVPRNCLQYLELNFVNAVEAFTLGKVVACLVLDRQGNIGS